MRSTFRLDQSRSFFDSQKVINAMEPEFRKDMARLGAYLRRVAINSIKRARSFRPAKRGKPPLSRTRLLKANISYSYDFLSRNLFVGPELLSVKSPYANATIPEVLEFGGTYRLSGPMSYLTVNQAGVGRDQQTGRFTSASDSFFVNLEAGDTVQRHPHPFMGPALLVAQERGKLLGFFAEGTTQTPSLF